MRGAREETADGERAGGGAGGGLFCSLYFDGGSTAVSSFKPVGDILLAGQGRSHA